MRTTLVMHASPKNLPVIGLHKDSYDVPVHYYGYPQTLTIKRVDYSDGTSFMRMELHPRKIPFVWQCTGSAEDISGMIEYQRSLRGVGEVSA